MTSRMPIAGAGFSRLNPPPRPRDVDHREFSIINLVIWFGFGSSCFDVRLFVQLQGLYENGQACNQRIPGTPGSNAPGRNIRRRQRSKPSSAAPIVVELFGAGQPRCGIEECGEGTWAVHRREPRMCGENGAHSVRHRTPGEIAAPPYWKAGT